MKKFCYLASTALLAVSTHAQMTLQPWTPVFQGIVHAVGTNLPDADIPRLQVAHCMRVDLSDPDVQLFMSPPATNWVNGSVETYSLTVSNLLKRHGLAIATDSNFYSANPGGSDPTAEGVPCNVYGLQICTGAVVSLPDANRYASLLFTTNKQPVLSFHNVPPGVSTAGIFTALTGYYPVLSNGVNIGANAIIDFPNDTTVHQPQPRTLIGLSQDRRYLYMATIDGRQPGYSDGATDVESGTWMYQFGARDAISMDGGGSTSLYRADCAGNPVNVNHSSYIGLSGGARERIVGSQFGVRARPLPTTLKNLTVLPGLTTATILWDTDTEATSQVDYGSTASYGASTPLDSNPKLHHVATIAGLSQDTTYYYRATSVSGIDTLSSGCSFRTTNTTGGQPGLIFDITGSWKYTTNNLDAVAWQSPGYVDVAWNGPSPGLLYIETNPLVAPRNTPLPSPLMHTYYFRRHFPFSGSKVGLTLTFSSYIDDGAVFYLNGVEVYRLRMPAPPTVINNLTTAVAKPCQGTAVAGDAGCADVFNLTGSQISSLNVGDNVMAVEVHTFFTTDNDVVFGSALSTSYPTIFIPRLGLLTEGTATTFYWNGEGFTLQQSDDISSSANWVDVSGPSGSVTTSPFTVDNTGALFYRLRQ